MEKPVIGIRQADGSFYEIMDEARTGRKRLVLSAARTDQQSVRIDLFRSEDGTLDGASALGSISLQEPSVDGFSEIEFRVAIGDDDQLEASAALPGRPPETLSVDLSPFRGPRSDADILGDASLDASDLDTLGDSFNSEETFDLEPAATLDLPELDETSTLEEEAPVDLPAFDEEPPRRTDADILGADDPALDDLDTLDDFSLDDAESLAPEPPVAQAADTFDLGDLDEGFGDAPDQKPAEAEPAEEWEKISLDDMETMEFMDTGDEISQPSAKTPPRAAKSQNEFTMDEEEAIDLGEMDSDFGELPDLDLGSETEASEQTSADDFDSDFLPPPALTETPLWDEEGPAAPEKPSKAGKAPKRSKPPKAPKGEAGRAVPAPESTGGVDKTALFLSLAALSLLVLLILVLLFLNMIKAPATPVIQPEVRNWNPGTAQAAPQTRDPSVVDLGSAEPVAFEASTVLEVPDGLRHARISMTLEPGLTTEDAARRFGPPARVEGRQLFW